MKQMTFAGAKGFEVHGRATRKAEFLARMDALVPWAEFCALVEPHYPRAGNGRPPVGVERMLRMYLLANWFNLSDEACEDALYDMPAFRDFCRIDLGRERAPDATTLLSVASRNFVTGCLTKDVTRYLTDEALNGLLPPHAHSLLQRMKLSQAVPPRVTRLKLDQQFKCGLIRVLLKTVHHLFPMVLEDVGTSSPRLVAKPPISFRADNDAARASVLAPLIDAFQKCLVLLTRKPTWELVAQLIEELHGINVGKSLKPSAYDRPHHAQRLYTGIARLRVERLQPLVRVCRCRGRSGWSDGCTYCRWTSSRSLS